MKNFSMLYYRKEREGDREKKERGNNLMNEMEKFVDKERANEEALV